MQSSSINVDLSIRVNGKEVIEYAHEGKTFVEAKSGTEYTVHLRNRNPYRVKAVVSVDGVNVVNGKPAAGQSDDIGYVLDAHATLDIKGYRLDNESVARFTFTKAEGSYAKADKGMEGTTGVIGLRVYKERAAPVLPPAPPRIVEEHHHHHWQPYYVPRRPWYWEDTVYGVYNSSITGGVLRSQGVQNQQGTYSCSMGATTEGLSASASTNVTLNNCSIKSFSDGGEILASTPFTMGSTFGDKAESRVTEVTFVTECCLGEMSLYYTERAGLEALGVDMARKAKVAYPAAFDSKYCSPPSGWKG